MKRDERRTSEGMKLKSKCDAERNVRGESHPEGGDQVFYGDVI